MNAPRLNAPRHFRPLIAAGSLAVTIPLASAVTGAAPQATAAPQAAGANSADTQSLPLGNGSLGVAEWAANGFTAQLNRGDTMPYRLSPGQIDIPGLSAMTSAPDFTGTLDLYNGVCVSPAAA